MSSTGTPAEAPSGYQPFTKAQHIQQLNGIDKSISQLLSSAGLALQTLSATHATSETPISERKEAFEKASESYLTTLQKVDVLLRRNIYGLEEANIIPAQGRRKLVVNGETDGTLEPDVASLGKLDIGWLNSRSGRVGRDMEAELWEKAKVFLEGLEAEKAGTEKRDEDMSA
ncbi:hypothetical protein ONS95_002600 [Cadophora gregata]|uniref:uncharacterized protein n=1 Tax=Cadophora gregata TaxID=51156 RepID=UPI0026DAFD45|nr:uncharacterized protein ONS95_002600 [Cadophora gregata]KAK0109931.1 hypothetical protein ONS95_002600 [Cadophora gregata]KAK0110440.1 hypothetical protein ONS96_002051 [Cadophora gregata f. sp. sojae]